MKLKEVLAAILCLTIKFSYADISEIEIMQNEVRLKICQRMGMNLYQSCVLNPKPDTTSCGIRHRIYIKCLEVLNDYTELDLATMDPYAFSPFSPCKTTIAELILDNICSI